MQYNNQIGQMGKKPKPKQQDDDVEKKDVKKKKYTAKDKIFICKCSNETKKFAFTSDNALYHHINTKHLYKEHTLTKEEVQFYQDERYWQYRRRQGLDDRNQYAGRLRPNRIKTGYDKLTRQDITNRCVPEAQYKIFIRQIFQEILMKYRQHYDDVKSIQWHYEQESQREIDDSQESSSQPVILSSKGKNKKKITKTAQQVKDRLRIKYVDHFIEQAGQFADFIFEGGTYSHNLAYDLVLLFKRSFAAKLLIRLQMMVGLKLSANSTLDAQWKRFNENEWKNFAFLDESLTKLRDNWKQNQYRYNFQNV